MQANNRNNINKEIEWYNQHGLGIFSNDPKVQEMLIDMSFETIYTFPALTPTYSYRNIMMDEKDESYYR